MLISAEGVEGDWTPWKFTHGNTSIFEVWIRSERYSGSGDDTATNGLRFKDSNHKTYEPYVGYWNKDDYCDSTTGGHWRYGLKHLLHGYWASATCRGGWTNANGLSFPGKVITGFRTQVEPDQGGGDDTALNRVEFQCDYDPTFQG